MPDDVFYGVDGAVATLRLDRAAKKNALTVAMYEALTRGLESAGGDPKVRALVVLGHPGAFCAGNDIQDFMAFAARGALGEPILAFLRALATFDKPLLAAVDGPAVGVGTTLLLHCDYVLATANAAFATPFVDLGLVPEAGSSLLGPRLMGHARAFELLVMGRRWNAARAAEAGLVNEIVASDALERQALAVASEIAAKAPEALALSRRLLRGDRADVLARIDLEAEHFKQRLASPEAAQAFMAFLSKKKG